jgi:hypothetical protein
MPITATYTPRLGERLPNGAVIIAARPNQSTNTGWIVLARSDTDYVIWRVSAVDGKAFWGAYFSDDFDEAVKHYRQR